MNKNELEARRLVTSAEKFGTVMNFLQHVVTAVASVWAIKIIFDGLNDLVQANPNALTSLAVVIEKLKIDSILSWMVTGLATLGYVYERDGKKRAIRKLKELRSAHEGEDPYNASSQLDENGHTPK